MTEPDASGTPRVLGATVDDETRCVHYRTELDIVAIRFACCGEYYPCHACHEEAADHPAEQWPLSERGREAVLCGVCRAELTIDAYLVVDACPVCASRFNERCRLHTHLYFETERGAAAAALATAPTRSVASEGSTAPRT